MIWRFRGREMTFEKVRIMGILNVTPDSFSDGGEYTSEEKAAARAREMEREGADLIDVGAESTRPGAPSVPREEELRRLLPVLRKVRSEAKLPISVDTTKAEVAEAALKEGAEIINDVDGLHAAREIAGVVRKFEAGLILMHRRGTAETMQDLASYDDVVEEVFEELDKAFRDVVSKGVEPEQIVLDPGIGFAKSPEQSLELLSGLRRFHFSGRPVLVGPSRKSFIGAVIRKDPAERDWGSAASVALAVAHGANIVRVHRVEGMRDAVRVAEAIVKAGGQSHVRSQ
jgi:dihydropteroate synthase